MTLESAQGRVEGEFQAVGMHVWSSCTLVDTRLPRFRSVLGNDSLLLA